MLSCFTQLRSADCFLKTCEIDKARDMEKERPSSAMYSMEGDPALLAFDFTSDTHAFATLEGGIILLRIFLVEDESIIRETLRDTVPWNSTAIFSPGRPEMARWRCR